MFYYLTCSYDIPDLYLDDETKLEGPFQTSEERKEALKEDLKDLDLETSLTVNVTLLKLTEKGLEREASFIADECDDDFGIPKDE